MRLLIIKNGDVAAELDRLSEGKEPPHSYISEIFSLRPLGELLVVGHSAVPGESHHKGVRARTLARQRKPVSEVKFNLALLGILRQFHPDVVIVLHGYELLVIPYVWSRINKKMFLPCIAGQPQPDNIGLPRHFLVKLVVRPLLISCPKILARATLIKRALIAWRIPGERISVYLPPYKQDFFNCGPLLPARPDRFNIVFIGRLVKLKGVYDLVDIINKLRDTAPSPHLFIIGSGPEQPSLERRVASKNVKEFVTFVGEIPQSDVYGYLAPADVALLPSHHEGLGKTALEALLSGVPVIATEGTGLSEFVEHNVNGCLLPKGDTDNFAAALTNLMTDPAHLAILKKNTAKTRDTILSISATFASTAANLVSGLDHGQETKVQQ